MTPASNTNDRRKTEDQPPPTATGRPPQTRENEEGASPDRQIAQKRQQSTGQGMGQS